MCHIMHRVVINNETIFKSCVEKLRTVLKTIRLSSRMRVDFKKIQILLGMPKHETKEITELDVENS